MSDILYRTLNTRAGGEEGFVLKPWVRYVMGHQAPLLKEAYAQAASYTVAKLLRQSKVIVAELADSPGDLFGFIAYEPGKCLHLVYVKSAARGMGIGGQLLDLAKAELPKDFEHTCATRQSRKFLKGSRYNPRLINAK